MLNSGSGRLPSTRSLPLVCKLEEFRLRHLYVTASYPDEIEVIQSGSGVMDAGFVYSPLKLSINHTSSGKIFASLLDGLDVNAQPDRIRDWFTWMGKQNWQTWVEFIRKN